MSNVVFDFLFVDHPVITFVAFMAAWALVAWASFDPKDWGKRR